MTKIETTTTKTRAVTDRHDQFMSLNYPRYDVAMEKGTGCELFDFDGNRYLDLFAGFGASVLGHCHKDLVAAVTRQANKLWHVGNLFHTEPQTLLAKAIAEHGFGGRSYFCHSGADANESAIKLARLYGGANPGKDGQRYKIISTTRSFHGRSFATMAATGNEKVSAGFGPIVPGFTHVDYNSIAAVESEIDDLTVALIVEPIQGEGGMHVPDPEYFTRLRQLCDKHDLLLIADEVWTGGGRTGKWFGYQLWDVVPDIMTLGKGVGGGLPVGVMCASDRLAELYDAAKQGGVRHASTLGGNCLSMAVAAAVFEVIERDGLLEKAATLGDWAMHRLNDFAKRTGLVRQVRGVGLFIGIDLDPMHTDAWFDTGSQVVSKAMEQGLLINATADTVLRLAPPIVIEKQQLARGLDTLEKIIKGS